MDLLYPIRRRAHYWIGRGYGPLHHRVLTRDEGKRWTRRMTQQRSVWPKNISRTMIATAGVLTALAGLVPVEVAAIASRLDASALDPTFCSPSSLHTTAEPSETQLTRDYGAIRILLKDPGDHFSQIRRVYGGELHVF